MGRRFALFLLLNLMIVPTYSQELQQGLRNIPFPDPIYAYLQRAYARGWLDYLPNVRPYTVSRAMDYLNQIRVHFIDHPELETPLLRKQLNEYLDRLRGERFHFVEAEIEGGGFLTLDFPFYIDLGTRLNDPSDTALILGPAISGSLSYRDILYLDMETWLGVALLPYAIAPYRKYYEPNRYDQNVYTWFLTQGEGSFNHNQERTPGETDLSYFLNSTSQGAVDFGLGSFHLGRGVLSWGPSPLANLSLSRMAAPYEFLLLSIPFGKRGSFTWMTGFLEDWGRNFRNHKEKLISVHRAELQFFPWFQFSFYEAVVYSRRFEINYLIPFNIYYVAEVRVGDFDNKFVGVDLVFRLPPVKSYISIFFDDWDITHAFNPSFYHNEGGIILGAEVYDLLPHTKFILEYIYLNQWAYTHKEDFEEEEHNHNSYQHYDSHLGHFLGPNAHMIRLNGQYDLRWDTVLGADIWFTQDGQGDIDTPPDWKVEEEKYGVDRKDLFYDYLEGPRETNVDFTLFAEHRIPLYGLLFKGSAGLAHTWNVDKEKGKNRWDLILSLQASFLAE